MAGRPAGEILAEGRSRDASVRRRQAAAASPAGRRRSSTARPVAPCAGRRLSCVPAVQLAARAAYLGKTVLYGVVGALALQAALGLRGGRTIDVKEALAVVGAGAAGRATTALVAVAIATLGCWFVLDGLTNAQRTRRGPLQAISRVGQGIGGLGYVALGGIGVRLALGEGIGPSGDEIARAFAARVLTQPTGPLAMGVVGLAAMMDRRATGAARGHARLPR